ncbi:hypothetical protein TNCV_372071 [Trichonephila clavipes]|nr:hypothetical protein TNCV_372071 [Trichonephila clavipes]
MNKESATVALRKFRLQKNVKTGKGPSTVVHLILLVQRLEETGSLKIRTDEEMTGGVVMITNTWRGRGSQVVKITDSWLETGVVLIKVQNYGPWFKTTRSVAKCPRVAERCDVNIHSLTNWWLGSNPNVDMEEKFEEWVADSGTVLVI